MIWSHIEYSMFIMHVSYTNFRVTTDKENKTYQERLQKTHLCGIVNRKEGIIAILQKYAESCWSQWRWMFFMATGGRKWKFMDNLKMWCSWWCFNQHQNRAGEFAKWPSEDDTHTSPSWYTDWNVSQCLYWMISWASIKHCNCDSLSLQ